MLTPGGCISITLDNGSCIDLQMDAETIAIDGGRVTMAILGGMLYFVNIQLRNKSPSFK